MTEDLQQHFRNYECHLLVEETSRQELLDIDSDLPSDTHLVEYLNTSGEVVVSGIRAFKMVDIFDALHDREDVQEVLSITQGFGRIKPKLFQGGG